MQAQMLAPAAVLVVWTLIVLLWIIPARFGAVAKVDEIVVREAVGDRHTSGVAGTRQHEKALPDHAAKFPRFGGTAGLTGSKQLWISA